MASAKSGTANAIAGVAEVPMDLLIVVIVVAFFALAWAYTLACDRV